MARLATSRIAWGIYLAGAFILFGIEATDLFSEESPLRRIAAWAWLICSCLVLISAFIYSLLPFFDSTFRSSRNRGWYFVAYFLPPLLVLFDINGTSYTLINTESTQQIGRALQLMHQRNDFGLFSSTFLEGSYPARQYLLAALPSLFFGKGLVTLRMGYGALYLIGYLSFLSGLRAYLKNMKSDCPELIASFAGLLISLANYPLLFARIFEQTIVPLSVTLLFLAGLLFFLTRPSPLSALWIMWSLGLLTYSYTPALAFWILAMILLAYLCFPFTQNRTGALVTSLVYGLATLTTSLVMHSSNNTFGKALRIGEDPNLNLNDWLYRYFSGLHATIGLEDSLIPAPLMLGCLIVLYTSLRQRDFRFFLLCLWAAAVVVVSLTVKGHCWRPSGFDVHRAMVILPPLSVALALYLATYLNQFVATKNEALIKAPIIGSMAFMILSAVYLPFIDRSPRDFYPNLMTDTEEATMLIVHEANPNPSRIYLIPPFNCALEDSLRYFSPETQVIRNNPPPGDHQPDTYCISYINTDPSARDWDPFVRHANPRPFLQIKPE